MTNIKYVNVIYHKVKLGESGMNPLPSDYEAHMLTIWLKVWISGQVAATYTDRNITVCHTKL